MTNLIKLGLNDIIKQINADRAWQMGFTGKGVHIAIIDTGIEGKAKEFSTLGKKSPYQWSPSPEIDPWTDSDIHGTMIACIAAANSQLGGQFSGVAPDATLISCKPKQVKDQFPDQELCQAYEFLIQLVVDKKIGRLVVNNSYAIKSCHYRNHSQALLDIVKKAVANNIVLVFAAGDNHNEYCGHNYFSPFPNTIWGANALPEVITVSTVDRDLKMPAPTNNRYTLHANSSRGIWDNKTEKPDCSAPTYGEVLWGDGKYSSKNWWGTSGAAPQVAGLAALMLEKNPLLTPPEIQQIIKNTCQEIPNLTKNFVGRGLIDCYKAIKAVPLP